MDIFSAFLGLLKVGSDHSTQIEECRSETAKLLSEIDAILSKTRSELTVEMPKLKRRASLIDPDILETESFKMLDANFASMQVLAEQSQEHWQSFHDAPSTDLKTWRKLRTMMQHRKGLAIQVSDWNDTAIRQIDAILEQAE